MIRRAFPLALAFAALAACNAPEPPTGGLDASHPPGDGTCDADGAQTYIGQQARDELAPIILRETGAKTLRWGGPDTAFTMDYRTDRVNVIYDADGVIEQITCG